MAFRRNYRSFRGRSRFRRRSGLNWAKSQPPRKWQVGNFSIVSEVEIDDTSTSQEYVAQIIAAPGTFLPDTTADQRTITQAIRRIEVGGIVWTQFVKRRVWDLNASASLFPDFYVQQLWTINNVDSDGNPIGIDYPWGTNSQPVTSPLATQENRDEPVRILDRWCTNHWAYSQVGATNEFAASQLVSIQRSRSLRLKVPILDNQALCFTNHVGNAGLPPATGDSVVFVFGLVGTIYYRYRV